MANPSGTFKRQSHFRTIVEWSGCATGLLGAALLSVHTAFSGYGWILFLLSNCFMGAYGVLIRSKGLIILQAGFTVTSVIGIANWLLIK